MSESKYEAELDRCSKLLQGVLPIGQVKHIGLLQIAAGIEQLLAENNEVHNENIVLKNGYKAATASLSAWNWLADSKCTVQRNSVEGAPDWFVFDIDGDFLGSGGTPIDAIRTAMGDGAAVEMHINADCEPRQETVELLGRAAQQIVAGKISGMTLLDYFAGQALVGLLSKLPLIDQKGEHGPSVSDKIAHNHDIAESCYWIANAMLAQHEEWTK